jgi:phage baseplate assembly protein W
VHPDLDSSATGLGLVTTPAGRLEWVQAQYTVRQALLLLLSTRPGERVMRPEYGCDLHQLVFEPNDDTTAGVAMHHVRRAIERWEPRVEILNLDANRVAFSPQRSPDGFASGDAGDDAFGEIECLEIVLQYRVRFLPDTQELRWFVSVTGEGIP